MFDQRKKSHVEHESKSWHGVFLPFLPRVACSHMFLNHLSFFDVLLSFADHVIAGMMRFGEANRFSHSQLESRARPQCLHEGPP